MDTFHVYGIKWDATPAEIEDCKLPTDAYNIEAYDEDDVLDQIAVIYGFCVVSTEKIVSASPAPNTIEINGRTFNKCYISDKQWDECSTPCQYCHCKVQEACNRDNPYCKIEHACYVDLGNIMGEWVNEE